MLHRTISLAMLFALIVPIGCNRETPKTHIDIASRSVESVANEIDITRLFSTAWFADEHETKAFPLNAGKDVNEFAWLHCTQRKTHVFFKNAGLKWRSNGEWKLVEKDFASNSFKSEFRFIDKDHFAILTDGNWLVFHSSELER